MRKRLFLGLASLLLGCPLLQSQHGYFENYTFTWADTLRGSLRPERTCYDVHFYELDIRIDPEERSIAGYVDIHYHTVEVFSRLQIDLYDNMQIDRIVFNGRELDYEREYHAVFVDFGAQQQPGSKGVFRVYYHGQPTVARQAPWDGGFVWVESEGQPWIGVACEGDGASLWWPNKDHLSDEPDSASIRVAVPSDLLCVSNGTLEGKESLGEYTRYDWFVHYPINNYNITVNIAPYEHFSDRYIARDGDTLALDYYVLPQNLEKAKTHFEQVPKMLACFERYFGKYPFWEDGFALVETPYLGMEHQSAIAYGNQYQRGYLGGMIPADMNWDYIIVHETGHEYFGNAVSCTDLADAWIHESFTTYMEALYVECIYSYQDAVRYLAGQRPLISNSEPIQGPHGVNRWPSQDIYYKGSWMLHTLRHVIDDDLVWFDLLRGFYEKHQIGHARTEDFIAYADQCTELDLQPFFTQYLQHPQPPVLQYTRKETPKGLVLRYRWRADTDGFSMPVLVGQPGDYQRIMPTAEWQSMTLSELDADDFRVATELFYIETEEISK